MATLEQYEILGEASKIPDWAATAKDKGRFPTGAGTFKIYYKNLCKAAAVDVNGVFGEDEPADKMIVQKLDKPDGAPTSAVGYEIKMVGTEIDKIKHLLTKKGGGIHPIVGKPHMHYHFSGTTSKPRVLLDFETNSRKYRITLTKTGITKRTIKSRTAGPKPTTPQNEGCTLRIIELVLGANTIWMDRKPAKLEDQITLFNNKIIPDLKDIWKGVAVTTGQLGTPSWDVKPTPGRADWYWHYLAQFIDCLDAFGGSNSKILIPNNHYDFFDYKDFMELITNIIEKEGPPDVDGKSWEQNPELAPYFYNAPHTRWPKGPGGPPVPTKEGTWPWYGKIGKKDTWNPADIWIVKKDKGYDILKEAVGTKFKISQVNSLLRKAYRDGDIMGISLKKSNATTTRMGTTHWSFHNLSFDPKEKRATGRDPLQKIVSGDWKMLFPFSGSNFTGSSFEWTLIAEANNKLGLDRKIDKFRMGSSATGEQSTQNYEMAPGGGAAQYGKVPLNIMKDYFKNQTVVTYQNRPTNSATNPKKAWLQTASPSSSGYLIPERDHVKNLMPAKKDDENYENWTKIVRKIKGSQLPKFTPITGIDKVVDNLIKSGPEITKENNVIMQELLFANLMIDFVGKGGQQALQKVIRDLYYMSQKIGHVGGIQFGPFHKWS